MPKLRSPLTLVLLIGNFAACSNSMDAPPGDDSTQTPPGALRVSITAPVEGAKVQDLVAIHADAQAAINVACFVDGKSIGALQAGPFDFSWNSITAHENPLPAAGHAFDFGYYFTDGRYGDLEAEVRGYTNLYYAWAWRNYPTDMPWGPPFSTSLANASAAGRRIHLNLQDPMYFDEALDRAKPSWSEITRVELADEPPWDRAETERQLMSVRGKLSARGLGSRPLGIVYTRNQVLNEDALFANGLDWVGIEAYIDPPGSSTSKENVDALMSYVNMAKLRVPMDKKLVLIMMAYDRNGGWKNLSTLIDLQEPVYALAQNDPRVLAVTMFSYGRSGGTHDHPELGVPHRRMGERILGRPIGALSNGAHTVEVVATGNDGETARASVSVTVENP